MVVDLAGMEILVSVVLMPAPFLLEMALSLSPQHKLAWAASDFDVTAATLCSSHNNPLYRICFSAYPRAL